ncbi:sodium/potassium/calcium exchanger 4 isoform X5 [Drosophila suzukii]|uniref:Sodium/potassium/calcium exchanger 4 isoform X5 n=1 Tax=Drosophila suzukii TaxID=28584 RepID=A0ABM4TTM1_DROSZ
MEDYWGLSSTTDINCTQPAIDDFPRDLFSEAQRQSGAVVLHVIASLYLFVALAVVCDEYFVPAVEKICAALNMSNDVAGATFMAAATSAPELFVNVIGTFITEGDIGVGTIVGSAVFNILAVAACCGIGAGMTIPLDWWPLTRDSIAYGVTVAILICVMHDERVEWYEALILVSLYAVYLAVMYFDKTFQKCAKGDTLKIPDSVMGITFLAAGTSVPEAVSSVIVAKRGHGSMGICNSIGSNTFDILLCLGVPWLIKAVFFPIQPGQNYVAINSAGLEYSAITLLSTLFLLYLTFSTNKFKLDKKVGTACLVMYLVFMVFASLIELNVFFRVNLPTCGRS